MELLSYDDVLAAAKTLSGVANRTPIVTSRRLDDQVGGSIYLKCETFQRSGSFKFRGAYNFIRSLPEADLARGVCAVSSGNHAQAVALAASIVGTPAAILMPEDAPAAKLAATRGYGAEVVTYDRYSMPQRVAGDTFTQERGMTFVPAYDHPRIAAGAGTALLEVIVDVGAPDLVIAPVGGGGGITGYSTVAKASDAGCVVVGVEPAAGGVMSASLAAGERVEQPVPRTIADGQMLTTPGQFTFDVIRERVDQMVLVNDEDIVSAMRFLFDRLKLVTEPSGAIAFAAVLNGSVPLAGRRAAVIVSGGNVGVDRFVSLVAP